MAKIRLGVLAGVAAFALGGCIPFLDYGANFDYPAKLPVPASATEVLTDQGWDDDDPIRTQIQVLDFGDTSEDAIAAFYVNAFTAADGWAKSDTASDEILCLVRTEESGYTEVIEVDNYTGSRVAPKPGRMLTMTSRIEEGYDDYCDVAWDWVPGALIH